jgi:predicted RNA-binding protein
MRYIWIGCFLVVGLVLGSTGVVAAEDVTIVEDKTTGARDCQGGIAKVMSNKNTLTLKNCSAVHSWGNQNVLAIDKTGTLEVMGNKNIIQVGQVTSIDVKGNKNAVTYKSGPKGKKPSISNLGNENTITQK